MERLAGMILQGRNTERGQWMAQPHSRGAIQQGAVGPPKLGRSRVRSSGPLNQYYCPQSCVNWSLSVCNVCIDRFRAQTWHYPTSHLRTQWPAAPAVHPLALQ